MELRRFKEADAVSVSELIRKTIRISNTKDYPTELMDALIEVETPASITGVPFYLKMGYHYKNGISEPDEEHLIRMEKNR